MQHNLACALGLHFKAAGMRAVKRCGMICIDRYMYVRLHNSLLGEHLTPHKRFMLFGLQT
jgi:hypothetical protein